MVEGEWRSCGLYGRSITPGIHLPPLDHSPCNASPFTSLTSLAEFAFCGKEIAQEGGAIDHHAAEDLPCG